MPDAESHPPILVAHDLHKSLGGKPVLKGVSCSIPRGGITVILGPSGAGKSVFLKCLVGLFKPDRGEVHFGGKILNHLKGKELYELRKRVGMLFQDGALLGNLDLFENVAFPLRQHTHMTEKEIRERVSFLLSEVGLSGKEKVMPSELSGGMRKRVGLARALVMEPEVVFCDEPTSGLDPVTAAAIDELILRIAREHRTTFVVISHDLHSTQKIADFVGFLYGGTIRVFVPAEKLFLTEDPYLNQFLHRTTQGPLRLGEV
jgi:phospholipid/cholesterol/gamma-HCH transport system ATP-binding protein